MNKTEVQRSPIFDERCINETYKGARIEELENFRQQALRFLSDEDPAGEDLEAIRTGLTKTRDSGSIIFNGKLPSGIHAFRSVSLRSGTVLEVYKTTDKQYVLHTSGSIDDLTVNTRRGNIFPEQVSLQQAS